MSLHAAISNAAGVLEGLNSALAEATSLHLDLQELLEARDRDGPSSSAGRQFSLPDYDRSVAAHKCTPAVGYPTHPKQDGWVRHGPTVPAPGGNPSYTLLYRLGFDGFAFFQQVSRTGTTIITELWIEGVLWRRSSAGGGSSQRTLRDNLAREWLLENPLPEFDEVTLHRA